MQPSLLPLRYQIFQIKAGKPSSKKETHLVAAKSFEPILHAQAAAYWAA